MERTDDDDDDDDDSTNLSTHSVQKSTLLFLEQSLQCHLVPDMGLIPQPSHCQVKILRSETLVMIN